MRLQFLAKPCFFKDFWFATFSQNCGLKHFLDFLERSLLTNVKYEEQNLRQILYAEEQG